MRSKSISGMKNCVRNSHRTLMQTAGIFDYLTRHALLPLLNKEYNIEQCGRRKYTEKIWTRLENLSGCC